MESQITDRLAARSAAREASGEESCPPPDDPDATKVIGPFEFRRYPNEHEAGLLVHRSRVRELEIVLRTNVFRSDAEKLLSELRAALRTFPDLPRLRLFLGSYVGQHAGIAHYSHGNDQAAFWAEHDRVLGRPAWRLARNRIGKCNRAGGLPDHRTANCGPRVRAASLAAAKRIRAPGASREGAGGACVFPHESPSPRLYLQNLSLSSPTERRIRQHGRLPPREQGVPGKTRWSFPT